MPTETRETSRFTVTGTVPPSTTACVADPLITNPSGALSDSRLVREVSCSRVVISDREGAFTRAQTVRSPEVAVRVAVMAVPASL